MLLFKDYLYLCTQNKYLLVRDLDGSQTKKVQGLTQIATNN